MIGILLILTVSATAFAGQYHTGVNGEKPGRCSRSDVITNCLCPPGPQGCNSDYDCPYNLKCCSYGCGCRRECRAPDFSTGPLPVLCVPTPEFNKVSFNQTLGCLRKSPTSREAILLVGD
uniref:Uncharacterized protein n=1 Tax=Magallana gigas TaxID=29159 RepID=K1PWI0_MAGGI